MPISQTIFTSDEAQALLDFIDKVKDSKKEWFDVSEEEQLAYNKLQEAGKFYVP